MIRSIYRDALSSIHKQEQKVSLESAHIINEAHHMTIFLRDLLSEVKKLVLEHRFSNEKEEIEFFKKVKPQILGKLIYYNKVYRIEISCPVSNGKLYHKYFSNELELLKQEYKEHIYNSDFYRYYRSGRTDRDHDFFQLGKVNLNIGMNSFIFEIDNHFSTYYDYKIARIIANELLYTYLLSKINFEDNSNLIIQNSESAKDVFWTDSKNALIELIYALHVSGAISNGKIGIRKISLIFQLLFRTELGDIHHAFHRMKDRAGNRTLFLDQLKSSLEQYMDKDL